MAQASPTGAQTPAEELFHDGRQLILAGDHAGACAKLRESQRLQPSAGALLNLGECSEKQGKLASAWAFFNQAAALGDQTQKSSHADEARRRARALAPRLSRLTVTARKLAPGQAVFLNEAELPSRELGVRTAVDGGRYRVRATAPERREWATTVVIAEEADDQQVELPELAPVAAPGAAQSAKPRGTPVPQKPRAHDAPTPEPDRTLSYVLGGVGLAALAVGGTFGVLAIRSYSSAESACPSRTGCSDHALDLRERASNQALIANLCIGSGLVVAGFATYLYLDAGSSTAGTRTGQYRGLGLAGSF